jgi:predicted DNA-binding ribbon-helix-helix protein
MIAIERDVTLSSLVAGINAARNGNLSSAIRLFVLDHCRAMADAPAASQGTHAEMQQNGSGSVPRLSR